MKQINASQRRYSEEEGTWRRTEETGDLTPVATVELPNSFPLSVSTAYGGRSLSNPT